MELSTIIGLTLGILALGLGMVLKGASLAALVNPAAYMIIFVGTAASLFIGFPMSEIKKFPVLIKIIFKKPDLMSKKELIDIIKELALITRREGVLALEEKLEQTRDPFLKKGLQMVIDGSDNDFIRDALIEEISAMEDRHKSGALIFSQAGTYAPTLGVLGAVIGLIAALGNLTEVDKLGSSIAAAFIATLLGIFSGYVLWHPIANKLRRLSKQEVDIKLMMVEGVLSLQMGMSPANIEQKLSAYLSPSERAENVAEQEAMSNVSEAKTT